MNVVRIIEMQSYVNKYCLTSACGTYGQIWQYDMIVALFCGKGNEEQVLDNPQVSMTGE